MHSKWDAKKPKEDMTNTHNFTVKLLYPLRYLPLEIKARCGHFTLCETTADRVVIEKIQAS